MKKLSVFLTVVLIFLVSSAYSHAVETIVGNTFSAEKGDFVFYVRRELGPDHPDIESHFFQTRLAVHHAASKALGICNPYGNLSTYDGTDKIVGRSSYWEHMEIALKDKECKLPEGYIPKDWTIVIMRPTKLFLERVDYDAAIQKAIEVFGTETCYHQPTIYALLLWMQQMQEGRDWYTANLFPDFEEAYGVNFGTIDLKAPQYSPYMGTAIYNDLGHPGFWNKYFDCSSASMSIVLYGLCLGAGEGNMVVDPALIIAIDMTIPGEAARWLKENNLAEVVLQTD